MPPLFIVLRDFIDPAMQITFRAIIRPILVLAAALVLSATAATSPEAQIDCLRALNLAAEGSHPEALRWLAKSLRAQPQGNPAAGLAFTLLTNLRVQTGLRLRGHTAAITHAEYSRDGNRIVTTSADHTARIWNADTGAQLTPPLVHPDDVLWAEFSPDGKLVATAGDDGIARVWDAATGRLVSATAQDSDEVKFVHFSPDGKLLAGGTENQGYLWDPRTGKPAVPPFASRANVYSIDFSPDGLSFVASIGNKAQIFDTRTGEPTAIFLPHEQRVYVAKYSADGSRIFTCSSDRTGRVWDAKTGQPLTPPLEHGFWVFFGDFSPDGKLVATASADHTARVWDARTGSPATPLLEHAGNVEVVRFSPDSSRLATVSGEGALRVWDTASGERVIFPIRTDAGVTTAAFRPDGRSLVLGSRDGAAMVVDLPPAGPVPAWLADLADFESTQVKYNEAVRADLGKITALRKTLLESKSTDAWTTFGRWYFAEGAVRPISPWSKVTLEEYVNSLIELGDRASIDYAASLSADQPSWMLKLLPLQEKFRGAHSTPSPKPVVDPD